MHRNFRPWSSKQLYGIYFVIKYILPSFILFNESFYRGHFAFRYSEIMEKSEEDLKIYSSGPMLSPSTAHRFKKVSQTSIHQQGSMYLLKPELADHHLKAVGVSSISMMSAPYEQQLSSKTELRSVRSSNLNLALQQLQLAGSHVTFHEENTAADPGLENDG